MYNTFLRALLAASLFIFFSYYAVIGVSIYVSLYKSELGKVIEREIKKLRCLQENPVDSEKCKHLLKKAEDYVEKQGFRKD